MYATSGSRISTANKRELELLDEIALLQRRLEMKAMYGDCSYERAISKLYQGMIKKRKQQLTTLQVSLY
jgi:hypothetical protein